MNVRRTHTLAIFVVAALLAACNTLTPEYQRPAAPVAPIFPGDASGVGKPAPEIEWQAFFTDERVKRLIAIALQHNRDLRVAALAIEQARAQLQVRRADAFPTVNVGASGLRQPNGNGDGRPPQGNGNEPYHQQQQPPPQAMAGSAPSFSLADVDDGDDGDDAG